MKPVSSTKYYVAILLCIFLWSTAFSGIRYAIQDFSAGSLALLRFSVASLVMAIFYIFYPQKKRPTLLELAAMIGIGILGFAIYSVALNQGEKTVPAALASFIASQTPVVVAICAVTFFKEKINFLGILGFIVSIVGVGLIFFSEQQNSQFDEGFIYLLIALAAACGYIILQKPLLKKFHAIEVIAYATWGGTAVLLIYLPQLVVEIPTVHISAMLTVIYLGIVPAAFAYILWSYAYAQLPSARASSFLYLIPFFTLIVSWIWMNEMPNKLALIGGLIAIIGAYLIGSNSHARH